MVTPITTFGGVCDAAFNPIRQYGRGHVSVLIRLLEVLTLSAPQMRTTDQREALLRHAEIIYRDGAASITEPHDAQDLRHRWESARRALAEPSERPVLAVLKVEG